MLKSIPVLVFLTLPFISIAQVAPEIQWQQTYGSSAADGARAIKVTSDGGYIVAGSTAANDGDVSGYHGGTDDAWVLKLDALGAMQWQHAFGGTGTDNATDIYQTSDGGYIVAAATNSIDGDVSANQGSFDAWLIKLDANGNLEWQRTYGGSSSDGASSVVQTEDGGYVFAGSTGSNDGDVTGNHGGADYWVVKLDENGDIEWQKALGGTGYESAEDIQKSSDGGYIISGTSGSSDGDISDPQGGTDMWVVKLNPAGDLEWERSLGGPSIENGWTITQTQDGGYITAGDASGSSFACSNGSSSFYVAKLDSSGETEWQRTCLGGSGNDQAIGVVQTMDGGFAVAGSTGSDDGDVSFNHGMSDAWVVRLDPDGNSLWERTYGGSQTDRFTSILVTSDGGYSLAGFSSSSDGDVTENKGQNDLWVVKLGPDHVGIAQREAQPLFSLSPNPASEVVSIHFEQALPVEVRLKLLDAQGRHLATPHEGNVVATGSDVQFSVAHLPAGMYAVQLISEGGIWTQRFVKE
ncbi:MAG: T9SS type A sorting domain-containing protein [Flavobacteriales bacterium]|nr:T9SS type A sorting domain-containing protein [Flavobacteriales bacterium]